MQVSVEDIARLVRGRVEGDAARMISHPAKIEEAREGSICFLANLKYEHYLYTTAASAVLVPESFVPSEKVAATLIRVPDVYSAVAVLLDAFGQQQGGQAEVSSLAFVHSEAEIGAEVSIGPFAVIEAGARIGKGSQIGAHVFIGKNVQLGEQVLVHSGARICHESEIGDHCILHPNAVIGSDGFGFARQADGSYKKIAQIGKVILEAEVEVGANTVIDRATMGATIIRRGAKLDNLIQVAHNVEIGSKTAIAAQAGIAGSAKIGEECLIGGQVGIAGHLQIADKTEIQAKSGISSNIKTPGSRLYGYPAIEYVQYLKAFAVFKRLPELARQVEALEKKAAQQGS